MNAIYPLTLLYDAACPVCALEMDHLRARNDAGRLVFIDISAPDFDAKPFGVTLTQLDAEIHAVRADGQLIKGVQVLRLAYEAVGLGWVMRATGWVPLRGVSDVAYRLFARHRRKISNLVAPLIAAVRAGRARQMAQRMQQCNAGQCVVNSEKERSHR